MTRAVLLAALLCGCGSVSPAVDSATHEDGGPSACSPGVETRYVLRLLLKEERISVSLQDYLEDSMNQADFEIYTDRDMYERVEVGTDLFHGFRDGSLIVKSSFGHWHVEVAGKRIVNCQSSVNGE